MLSGAIEPPAPVTTWRSLSVPKSFSEECAPRSIKIRSPEVPVARALSTRAPLVIMRDLQNLRDDSCKRHDSVKNSHFRAYSRHSVYNGTRLILTHRESSSFMNGFHPLRPVRSHSRHNDAHGRRSKG